MKFKVVIVISMFLLFASGCSNKDELDSLMKPPKLSASQSQISEIMVKFIPKDARLIIPSYGENQKSIEYIDIDGDKKHEAIIFFKEEGKQSYDSKIGFLILKQIKDKWNNEAYISEYGNSIESVTFKDVDGDRKYEIILDYKMEGSSIENIGIYKENESDFKKIFSAPCSNFILDDLDMDGTMELIVFNDEKCTLYKDDKQGLSEKDEADFLVFEGCSIVVQAVNKSSKAIFIKSESFSEEITVKDNKLQIIEN